MSDDSTNYRIVYLSFRSSVSLSVHRSTGSSVHHASVHLWCDIFGSLQTRQRAPCLLLTKLFLRILTWPFPPIQSSEKSATAQIRLDFFFIFFRNQTFLSRSPEIKNRTQRFIYNFWFIYFALEHYIVALGGWKSEKTLSSFIFAWNTCSSKLALSSNW